jgi:hypothetical protein
MQGTATEDRWRHCRVFVCWFHIFVNSKKKKNPTGFRFVGLKALSVAKYNSVAIFHNLSQKRLWLGNAQ